MGAETEKTIKEIKSDTTGAQKSLKNLIALQAL